MFRSCSVANWSVLIRSAIRALVITAGSPRALRYYVVEITIATYVVVSGSNTSAVASVHLPLPKTNSALAFGKLVADVRNRVVVIVAVSTSCVSQNCFRLCTIDLHLRTGSYGTETDAGLHLHVQDVLLGLSGLSRLR